MSRRDDASRRDSTSRRVFFTERLARLTARHPLVTLAVWAVVAVGCALAYLAWGDVLTTTDDSLTTPEAKQVEQLVAERLPGAGADTEVMVGGVPALYTDAVDLIESLTPWVIGVVLGLSFLLLLVAFRSLVIAVQAILMNLLSVGAAYGLVALVFQNGVGAELLGFTQVERFLAWLPLLMFCVLFGLALAVAIDATIVRTVIVPAAMTLTGRWCWYLPRWLEWLPKVRVDEGEAEVESGTEAGARPLPQSAQEAARP